MMVAERVLGVLIEILAIDKGHRVYFTRVVHFRPRNEKPHRGPFRAKSGGELFRTKYMALD